MPLMRCPIHGTVGGGHVCAHIFEKAKTKEAMESISIFDADMEIGGLKSKYFYCLDCAADFKIRDGQVIDGLMSEENRPEHEILSVLKPICGFCFKEIYGAG
jgi:hypothetical protein